MVRVTGRARNDLKCVEGRKTEIKPNHEYQVSVASDLICMYNIRSYVIENL